MSRSRKQKLIRTFLIVMATIVWVFSFTIRSNFDKSETPEQMVNRLRSFYVDSWYDKKSLYEADIELLQEYKNEALNKLTYRQTLEYVAIQNWKKEWLIDNDWLNLIDEVIALALEWKSRVEVPEYLKINTKTLVEEQKQTASDLVFQNLVQ